MPEVVKYYLFYVWYVPNDVGYLEVESYVVEKKNIFQIEMLQIPGMTKLSTPKDLQSLFSE